MVAGSARRARGTWRPSRTTGKSTCMCCEKPPSTAMDTFLAAAAERKADAESSASIAFTGSTIVDDSHLHASITLQGIQSGFQLLACANCLLVLPGCPSAQLSLASGRRCEECIHGGARRRRGFATRRRVNKLSGVKKNAARLQPSASQHMHVLASCPAGSPRPASAPGRSSYHGT